MTKPVRIQRKRTKGYDMQADSRAVNGLECVYVGRPTKWRNLWKERSRYTTPLYTPTARQAFESYRKSLEFDGYITKMAVKELRGKNLACWCAIISHNNYCYCHADVLLAIANNITMDRVIYENIRRSKGEKAQ